MIAVVTPFAPQLFVVLRPINESDDEEPPEESGHAEAGDEGEVAGDDVEAEAAAPLASTPNRQNKRAAAAEVRE
mgnify:CR=1 FL=1